MTTDDYNIDHITVTTDMVCDTYSVKYNITYLKPSSFSGKNEFHVRALTVKLLNNICATRWTADDDRMFESVCRHAVSILAVLWDITLVKGYVRYTKIKPNIYTLEADI